MRMSLLVAALIGVVAVGSARDPLPDPALKAVTEADIAYLTKTLDAKVEKRAVNTVKATAMLLALAAQKDGNGALQEHALAVAGALAGKEKDFAAAKAAAGKLAGATGGTPKAVALHEQHKFDLDQLMSVFRAGKVGGLNMEKDIKDQGKKLTDVKLAEVTGARLVLIADYTAKYPHTDATGPKKKQWDDWTKEMGDLGAAVAAEAGKGAKADKSLVEKKLKALEVNCAACHSVFRDGK